VEIVAARGKIQLLLAGDDGQGIVVGGDAVGVDSRQIHEGQVVAHAARMVQQVQDGDGLAVIGQLRNVLANVVVHGELALLLEQQDARGSELLGSRADVKDGLWRDGDVLFQVGQAVASGVDDLPV